MICKIIGVCLLATPFIGMVILFGPQAFVAIGVAVAVFVVVLVGVWLVIP